MPASSSPRLETASGPRTRVRLWSRPELASHALIVLTADRLYLTPAAVTPSPEVLQALSTGADPEDWLGPGVLTIDLVAVRRVRHDLTANTLTVDYLGEAFTTLSQKIAFTTATAADACFTKLWRRLGDGFRLQQPARRGWVAARAPLVLLGLTLAATAFLVLLLSVFEDLAAARDLARHDPRGLAALGSSVPLPPTPLEPLLGWLDWRLVCGVGGAVAAVSQVWLYRRLTAPPTWLELVRS